MLDYRTQYTDWERNRGRNPWFIRVGAIANTNLSGKYDFSSELVYLAAGTGTIAYDTANTLDNAPLNIPLEWGLGFSVHRGLGLTFTGEAVVQNWSGFAVEGKSSSTFEQALRLAGGVEWIPNPENVRGFWNRMALRAGGHYQQTGWVVDGTAITGWGLSGGLGIPVYRIKNRTEIFSRVNLGAEYSSRGTTANGLVLEEGWKFVAGISLLQPWFRVWRYE
jgi:hypothetical protein